MFPPVKPIDIQESMKVSELVKTMREAGVMGAGRMGRAAEIMQKMFEEQDCRTFLGFAGALVPGGMKNIIIDLLESGVIDVLVTTGANLTHDLAEAFGHKHYQGSHTADDEALYKKGLVRMFDTYMPNKVYEDLEDFFEKNYDLLKDLETIKEFLWKVGELAPSGEKSILKTCYERKIPLFCPGIADSGIGLMIWGRMAKGKNCNIKVFEDLKEIMDLAWTAKKAGVIYLGGGLPKNFIQQAMQLAPNAAEYGVQITMDRPEPGGSSGAELREGISWGKMQPDAKFVDVICDVTIALPLLWAAVKNRL